MARHCSKRINSVKSHLRSKYYYLPHQASGEAEAQNDAFFMVPQWGWDLTVLWPSDLVLVPPTGSEGVRWGCPLSSPQASRSRVEERGERIRQAKAGTRGGWWVGAAFAAAAAIMVVVGSSKLGALLGSQAGSDIFQLNEWTTDLLTTNYSNIT